MAHTLYENQDLNSSKDLFVGFGNIKTDPEMMQLATQLVQRPAAKYEPADLEDSYEMRLRVMIDASSGAKALILRQRSRSHRQATSSI